MPGKLNVYQRCLYLKRGLANADPHARMYRSRCVNLAVVPGLACQCQQPAFAVQTSEAFFQSALLRLQFLQQLPAILGKLRLRGKIGKWLECLLYTRNIRFPIGNLLLNLTRPGCGRICQRLQKLPSA